MELVKNTEPVISVGIMSAVTIEAELHGGYSLMGQKMEGVRSVRLSLVDGKLEMDGKEYASLTFEPESASSYFCLHDVMIGINFHWQRTEVQRFSGALKIVVDGDKLWAVNRLPIEDYLYCVIASEMSGTSNIELLKAHAIVSRSWLVAQLQRKNSESRIEHRTDDELVKWYDRDDHHLFDVCADDHCQRYQGLTRVDEAERNARSGGIMASVKRLWSNRPQTPVRQAIDETRGMLLITRAPGEKGDGEVCDARFSKCCGGVTETYETCWDDTPHRYLQSFADYTHVPEGFNVNLSSDDNASRWINASPDAFCNTQDARILRQVLNSYDQETSDFYRWTVKYTTEQISDLIARRTGIDFGTVTEIIPLERGASGRIIRLKIVGTKRTFIIGKELEIRRSLSESHLYSSAFVVSKDENGFVIRGAGWGHGVGMCQIGAAVMSERNFGFKSILLHYFRCAMVEKWWN